MSARLRGRERERESDCILGLEAYFTQVRLPWYQGRYLDYVLETFHFTNVRLCQAMDAHHELTPAGVGDTVWLRYVHC